MDIALSAESIRKISAARRDAVAEAIDEAIARLLCADHFDNETLQWLAHRARYQSAVTKIARLVRPTLPPTRSNSYLIYILIEPCVLPHVRMLRLCSEFGIVKRFGPVGSRHFPSIEELRRTAAGRHVLACVGDCHWQSASKTERAAYTLHKILAERQP